MKYHNYDTLILEVNMQMYETHVRSVRDLRNNFAEVNQLVQDHNHVIITNNGRGTAVLINMEEFSKYEQFLHELIY